MTTTTNLRTVQHRPVVDRGTALAFTLAAVAFNVGGALHPNDDGGGSKVEQLHDMLVQDVWYASHAGLLVSFALFTVAFARASSRFQDQPGTGPVLRAATWVSALTTLAMVPHLLAALGAGSIEDGRSNALSVFMTVDETLADAPWALVVALLALVGGLRGDLGNRATAVVGVVGGLSFAAAAVTIPFTDVLDGLFAVGGMGITLWALAVAGLALWRRRQPADG